LLQIRAPSCGVTDIGVTDIWSDSSGFSANISVFRPKKISRSTSGGVPPQVRFRDTVENLQNGAASAAIARLVRT
jgi:hypothetical protein